MACIPILILNGNDTDNDIDNDRQGRAPPRQWNCWKAVKADNPKAFQTHLMGAATL